uniref:Myb_DNA-bind_5 domain-containing protein n=1 Tax=Steinernema glaseri TaxID=37863 RepID=A0A1I7ZEY6_9BILA
MRLSSEEWKTSTKREAFVGMEFELEKLLHTASEERRAQHQKELDGFRNLFARFLKAKSTIEWSKIEPLPSDAIIPYNK